MIKRVVIVEDDFLNSAFLTDACERFGLHVAGTEDRADKAIAIIRELQPDCVLVDVRLKGSRDGIHVAEEVRRDLPALKIIFITGSDEPVTMARMKALGPHRILVKPIQIGQLRAALQ